MQDIKETLSSNSDCLERRGTKIGNEYKFKASVVIEEIMDVIEHKRVNPNASEYQRVIWELESVISEKKEI